MAKGLLRSTVILIFVVIRIVIGRGILLPAAHALGIDMLCATAVALAVQRTVEPRPGMPMVPIAVVGFLAIFTMLLASTGARVLLTGRPVDAIEMALTLAAVAGCSTALIVAGVGSCRLVRSMGVYRLSEFSNG
jgi:hypothetical protein